MKCETENAKKQSQYLGERVAVEQDENNRRFYRFSEGKLVEFELTKWEGIPIRTTREEVEAAEEFIEVEEKVSREVIN
jgi:hypothetical protein